MDQEYAEQYYMGLISEEKQKLAAQDVPEQLSFFTPSPTTEPQAPVAFPELAQKEA